MEKLFEKYRSLLHEFIAKRVSPGELQALKRSIKSARSKSARGPYKIPKSFSGSGVGMEYGYSWEAEVVSLDFLEAKVFVFDKNDRSRKQKDREDVTIEWEDEENDPMKCGVSVFIVNSTEEDNEFYVRPPKILDQVRKLLSMQTYLVCRKDEIVKDILDALSYQMKARILAGLPAER